MATKHGTGRGNAAEGLDALLAEAASARAARSLARCAEAVEDALASACTDGLADAAPVARALQMAERIMADPLPAELDAAPLLQRVATAHLIASSRLTFLRTSIPPLPTTARVARCMLAVVRELIHVVESATTWDGGGHEASLTVVVSEDFVTLVAASGEGALSVPTGSGADALARLGRLAEACGGAVRRRVHDGEGFKVGVALGVRTTLP